ncbi:hypothetical protein PF003_g17525 [Phytophthora fragariae]|nr:hypothetical protein PF003_g17525 [Phytophthora fragariae]
MENRELSMHEKPKTQNYTHLAPLSVNTLKKHMFGLEDILRGIVKQRLSGQKLGFAVDVSYYKGSADGYVDSVRWRDCTCRARTTCHEEALAEAARADESAVPEKVDLRWVPPTSNDVERLFSRAGILYSRLRRSLNPMTLETMSMPTLLLLLRSASSRPGVMNVSGRSEPISLPESMSTPLLLLLRSASSRPGLWTSEGSRGSCAAEAAWINSTRCRAAAGSSTRATFGSYPRESALLAGLPGSATYSGLSVNLCASGTDAQSSVLGSGGITKVLGRPCDVGEARGGAQAGEKFVVGAVLVVGEVLRAEEAVGVSGV